MGSSPVGSSSAEGFPKELTLQGLRRERRTRRRRTFFLVVVELARDLDVELETDLPLAVVDLLSSPPGETAVSGK